MSGAPAPIQQRIIETLLAKKELQHREILIAIAGRNWESLIKPDLLRSFLVALAQKNDPLFFKQMVTSLVTIPKIRPALLTHLYGNTCDALIDAITQFQQSIRHASSLENTEHLEKAEKIG